MQKKDKTIIRKYVFGKISNQMLEEEALARELRKKSVKKIIFALWLIMIFVYFIDLFFNPLESVDLILIPIILFIIYINLKPQKEDRTIATIFEYFIGSGLIVTDIIITVISALFFIGFLIYTRLFTYSGTISMFDIIILLFLGPLVVSLYTVFLIRNFNRIMDYVTDKIYERYFLLKDIFISFLFSLSFLLLLLTFYR